MGIVAHFLHQHHKYNIGPEGREIYTEVIAALSVVLSLIWLLPFTSQFLHYPFDLVISAAWFAAFGAFVNWIHRMNCGGIFHWRGLTNGSYCSQWKAAEAFSFISACFWLASAILVNKDSATHSNSSTNNCRASMSIIISATATLQLTALLPSKCSVKRAPVTLLGHCTERLQNSRRRWGRSRV